MRGYSLIEGKSCRIAGTRNDAQEIGTEGSTKLRNFTRIFKEGLSKCQFL